MESRYLYPVDTYQFENIRKRGKVYVDKTKYIFQLVQRYEYVFLSRPRRFGKSLLCNTFKAYFEGRKELFDGLAIASLEKEWIRYPVLSFTMSGLKNLTHAEARNKLGCFLQDYEKLYGCRSGGQTPGTCFRELLQNVHAQTGKKAVVLIDEYDAPILNLLHKPEERDGMREMMREFFQVLKDEGEHIRFVFMTGITRFSQMSIFSELNNLKNISMMEEYSGICGITKGELETTLRPNVEELAERLKCTIEQAYIKLRECYDGYRFHKDGDDVYAPYSVLNALNDGEIKEYWFESGTSSSLMNYLKYYPLAAPLSYDGVDVRLRDFNMPCEEATTPMPLLYQCGYLSIDTYDNERDIYTLHFPNMEVRNGLVNNLMPLALNRSDIENAALVNNMAQSIHKGDLSGALLYLRSYIAGIPYDIITKEEWSIKERRESFYKLLLYMAFSMLNANVRCEHKCILGRADVVIKSKNDVFVLEFKVDDTVDNALKQIDDKSYAVQWTADGRRVIKCGVRIDSEHRNLTHWRVTDVQGTTLDEQIFD